MLGLISDHTCAACDIAKIEVNRSYWVWPALGRFGLVVMAGSVGMSGSGQSRLDAIKRSGSAPVQVAQWYVHADSGSQGPFDLSEMREMLRLSRADADTSVNRIGTPAWGALRDDPVLGPYVTMGRASLPPADPAVRHVVVRQNVNVDALLRQHGAGHIGTPAGFWIRACAYIIDAILLTILQLLVTFAAVGVVGVDLRPGSSASVFVKYMPYLAIIAYFVMFNCGAWQATPGKRVLGIYIRRTDGHTITIAQALGRYFATGISMIPLGIGFFMAGWNAEKKALHDILCGTRVVHGKL